jgi:hypothetical protein
VPRFRTLALQSDLAGRLAQIEKSLEILREKAEAVHTAAMNLATTLGIFHGVNKSRMRTLVEGKASQAVNAIQFDLLQLLVIRVCAICETPVAGSRPDDAALSVLLEALNDRDVRSHLIERDRRWHEKMKFRLLTEPEAARHIKSLKLRWSALRRHNRSLDKLKHYRNKQLGHVTIGFEKSKVAMLKELWTVADQALSVARYVRLVFHQQDWDYRASSVATRADGRALVSELARAQKRNKSNRAGKS